MRVIRFDHKSGEARLQVESLDDLWHLSRLIEDGDTVRASTYRREERRIEDDARGEKKRVTLTLTIDKVEFKAFSERLRVSGRIVEGGEAQGRFHTINLEPGDVFSLTKIEWKRSHFKRLEDARTKMMHGVLFVCLDEDDAIVARAHEYGVETIAELHSERSGKFSEQSASKDYKPRYYEEIWKVLGPQRASGDKVVVIGPGFEKEGLSSFLGEKGVQVHVDYVSQSGIGGVNELLKKGAGNMLLRDLRIARETELVEQVLERIARDDPVAYGRDEVSQALELGAVETLLIHEDHLYDKSTEPVLELAERTRAKLHIISGYHDAGKRFARMGGIAAILRFKADQ
jgi:protein pelota